MRQKLLSKHAQAGGIIGTLAAVASGLFVLIVFAVITSKTKESLDSGCVNSTGATIAAGAPIATATTNCTYAQARSVTDNALDGAEDASDMGGLLMLMVILGAVFSVALGAFVLQR